jgi:hypothetical protein
MDHLAAHTALYRTFIEGLHPLSLSQPTMYSAAPPYQEALITRFEMMLEPGTARLMLPMGEALVDIPLSVDKGIDTRLITIQFDRFMVCAAVETSASGEVMMGEFVSATNVFTLDALSEIWSVVHLRAAQKIILSRVALMLTPIMSCDTAEQLGKHLGQSMTIAFAERFADAFLPSLVEHAQPTQTRCGDVMPVFRSPSGTDRHIRHDLYRPRPDDLLFGMRIAHALEYLPIAKNALQ